MKNQKDHDSQEDSRPIDSPLLSYALILAYHVCELFEINQIGEEENIHKSSKKNTQKNISFNLTKALK